MCSMCYYLTSNPEATLQLEIQDGDIEGAANADQNSSDKELTISDEQEQLFQRRLEEGYDLPDPEYVR